MRRSSISKWAVYHARKLWFAPTCCSSSVGIRSLFSKTGVWDQKLTYKGRLEIDQYWRPLIQEHDQRQIETDNQTFEKTGADSYYALSMFPYPSGNLHLGHVRVYTISDVMARYQRSKGKKVIQPMGWDAFGLPAENAAIERGIHPKEWTYSNIKRMKEQLRGLGLSIDWSREFATCSPSYYRWTQYIFLKMFEKGLAFQKKGPVNWDPVDMTVLADEQIDENGCSWRSGAKVEKVYLKQWYLRDTVFSESLLKGLDEVDPQLWKDIISIQKHWISECKGRRVEFQVEKPGRASESLTVYTEALGLLYGVSHLWVAPTHHLCVDTGVTREGSILPVVAIHPLTKQPLNLVVTDQSKIYKERDVMLAIPSLSERAQDFAEELDFPYADVLDVETKTLKNSRELNGLTRSEATEKMSQILKDRGIGGEKISLRLMDWLISRQRYWGTPIPIIHCPSCKAVPVPYDQLPVELPEISTLTGKGGKSPLAEVKDWVNVSCPKCGSPAKRECDTMDTFVDSSWYFLRYLDPHNEKVPFDPQVVNPRLPVDLYVGGKEHALLHLYFARFFCHFLHSLGLLEEREPFKNLLTQGMVRGESFRVKATGKYLPKDQVTVEGEKAFETETGEEVIVDWEKMSKSKYNGVDPEDVLQEYGIDSTRLCILSNVSPMSDRDWDLVVFNGVINWQRKIWNLVSTLHRLRSLPSSAQEQLSEAELITWEQKIDNTRNHTVNHVTAQFEYTFHINAAISRLHSYVAWLSKVPESVSQQSAAYERAVADLIVMISVMAPHFASELWAGLGKVAKFGSHDWEQSVLSQSWPALDQDFLMPLLYKINSVNISEIGVPFRNFNSLDEDSALEKVIADELFQQYLGQEIEDRKFTLMKDHHAVLNLKMPTVDLGLEGAKGAEKNKKIRKLSKQKKKLHVV